MESLSPHATMDAIAASLPATEKAQLHEVADFLLQVFLTLACMRYLDPEWIVQGPHDIDALIPMYRRHDVGDPITYLYSILPYIDTGGAVQGGPRFIQGSTFADFRTERDVERGRDPFYDGGGEDDDEYARVMRPWMTPLSMLGNHGSVVVYSAKTNQVWILDQESVGSSDLDINVGLVEVGEWEGREVKEEEEGRDGENGGGEDAEMKRMTMRRMRRMRRTRRMRRRKKKTMKTQTDSPRTKRTAVPPPTSSWAWPSGTRNFDSSPAAQAAPRTGTKTLSNRYTKSTAGPVLTLTAMPFSPTRPAHLPPNGSNKTPRIGATKRIDNVAQSLSGPVMDLGLRRRGIRSQRRQRRRMNGWRGGSCCWLSNGGDLQSNSWRRRSRRVRQMQLSLRMCRCVSSGSGLVRFLRELRRRRTRRSIG